MAGVAVMGFAGLAGALIALRRRKACHAAKVECAGQHRASASPRQAAAKPLVVVITTGGTIAQLPDNSKIKLASGEMLTAAVPQVADFACIEVQEFSRIGRCPANTFGRNEVGYLLLN